MVEDVRLFSDSDQAAVVIAAVVHGFSGGFIGSNPNIIVADDDSPVFKTVIRVLADGISQLVHNDGGINEIVEISELPDG